jgi:hypothetical protein
MRTVTTVLEVVFAGAIVAGVGVLFGLGWGLVTFGILGLVGSWWVNR